jgi:hypothetical protein
VSVFRRLPLTPYYVYPRWFPLAPTATATLIVTAGNDAAAMAGQFTASAGLTRTERVDILSDSGSLTTPASLSFTNHSDTASCFGGTATSPSLSGIEHHDTAAPAGSFRAAAFLDYLAIADRLIAVGTAGSGPTLGEYTFDPYSATFVGEGSRRELSSIPTGVRTTVLVQAVGNAAAVFAADDLLSAQFYPYGLPAAVFQPSADWYTAAGTQSGWQERQIVVGITMAQAALLQPSIRYVLDLFRAQASNPSSLDLVATFQFVAKSPWQP